jgi:biopolymer transport protein ExbD
LPKAATTEAPPTPALTVTMDAYGSIRLMDSGIDLNGLKSNLQREASSNPGVRVTLAADQSLPYHDIVAVLDLIKQAGVTRVALSTEK